MKYGDYIRTNSGHIGKVKRIEFDKVDESLKWYVYDKKEPNIDITKEVYINKPYIVNHSKNIIDLIQVDDYVNGYRILAMEDSIYENSKRVLIYKNQKERYERWIYIQECNEKIHTQDDIVEILTKEQYEQNCYKVVE